MAARAWTRDEVEAIVTDYLVMLASELRGESVNKTEHRRALKPKLDERSDSAIERKHMNISAVMIEFGYPYIGGYKPYANYQRSLLPEVVVRKLGSDPEFERMVARDVADATVAEPTFDDILRAMVDRPTTSVVSRRVRESPPRYWSRPTAKVDHLAREARNQALGSAGERFVVNYEQARLVALSRDRLAADVEHIAETRGDGVGFDILSFEETGKERLIEVKTTRYGALTPFYVTRNEVKVSEQESDRYHLYRVFEFRSEPSFFVASGAFSTTCELDPTLYRARLSG